MVDGMTNAASSHPVGFLLSRLAWPTAILFTGILAALFATVLWTSDNANETAAERQRLQITAALEQKLDDLEERLVQLTSNPGFFKVVQSGVTAELLDSWRWAAHYFEFSGAFFVTKGGRLEWGMIDALWVGQPAYDTLRPLLDSSVAQALGPPGSPGPKRGWDRPLIHRRDGVVSRMVSDGSAVYAIIALPVEMTGKTAPRSEPLAAVAYKRLGIEELRKLADIHAVKDLQLADTPARDGRTALTVYDTVDRPKAYLTWSPDRPGDLVRKRLVPLTLFGSGLAAVLFAFLLLHIRWIGRNLARSEENAQTLLGRDPLSGLPNRLLFAERLDDELNRLSRVGGGLAVMFLDLDRFKDVNDTFGHQAGDQLLKLTARRLENLLRTTDTLARFGGDEFAIIQTDLRSPGDAEILARRILDSITRPFEMAEAPVTVGISLGVALAPEHGRDRETLMRLADTALYEAKSEGRNRYRVFQRQMDETIRMRKVVEEDLRQAIANDELVLHYQPVFSADGESIVAVEALVRWPHPKQGMIPPTSFIGMAEERGLVIPLGEWVLRRACEDAKRWPHLSMAVNVSAIQFRHRDFVASVTRVLNETGFEPSRLELELTEGVVVEDADAAEIAMMELRGLGVNLALDDFGTGYSSLIYLRRFAFDKIKIDRSFLQSMEATGESAILVHSIVHLGRALGLTVTAEGVETPEQHRFLQALGCHQLQGYLFSPPVTAEEIDRIVAVEQGKGHRVTTA
jgi:diguanylate cyclase (GGDEF)-like protein